METDTGLVTVLAQERGLGVVYLTQIRGSRNPLGPRYTVLHEDDGRDRMRYDGPDLARAQRIYEKWAQYERDMI